MGEGQYLYRTTGVHSLQAIKQIDKTGEARNALDSIEYRDVQGQYCIVISSYPIQMPSRLFCNGVWRKGVKASPELASGLFCYAPLHNKPHAPSAHH